MSKTSMEALEDRMCTNCKVGLLYPHPEAREWVKCEFCGYSEPSLTPDPRVIH